MTVGVTRHRSFAARGCGPVHEIPDHGFETELHAIVRVIDTFDAVLHQCGDFLRRNRSAAAAKHPDVPGSGFVQPVNHVTKELVVTTLV